MATAMFAAGCFWGVEHTFRHLDGVQDAISGYSGGHLANPTYRQVCRDQTGHAETVQVEYDPETISYEELLAVFWKIHDPTQLNRQGPDFGTQYRSAIFVTEAEQRRIAEASKQAQAASGRHRGPVVTEITDAGPFYPAEEYHQRYCEKNGLPGCHI